MEPIPDGSLYLWMYRQGLGQVPLSEICAAAKDAGRQIRDKDFENYWNGWHRHQLYRSERDVMRFEPSPSREIPRYSELPMHPMIGQPEIMNRWVPCSEKGKPIIKWSRGCLTKVDAMSMSGCRTLAENLRGTQMMVVDCDGDHDEQLDLDTVEFLSKFMDRTHCLMKPRKCREYGDIADVAGRPAFDLPASYHLTFLVDRVVPTMHFPLAHVDFIGNRANSLRYLKNKEWNGLPPIWMDDSIWDEIVGYVEERSRR